MAQWLHRDPSAFGVNTMPETGKNNSPAPATVPSLPLSRVFRTAQFWTICLLNLFLVFGLMVIMLHIVPHVRDSVIPPIQAAAVLSIIGAVSMLGRFVSGLVIDERGGKKVMNVCFLLLLGALVWLQFAHRLWMLYLFAVLYGLAHGGFFTAILPLVAEWFGIDSHGTLFRYRGLFRDHWRCHGPAARRISVRPQRQLPVSFPDFNHPGSGVLGAADFFEAGENPLRRDLRVLAGHSLLV
jgi:hypothetical protein